MVGISIVDGGYKLTNITGGAPPCMGFKLEPEVLRSWLTYSVPRRRSETWRIRCSWGLALQPGHAIAESSESGTSQHMM